MFAFFFAGRRFVFFLPGLVELALFFLLLGGEGGLALAATKFVGVLLEGAVVVLEVLSALDLGVQVQAVEVAL